jgi:uncharacterized protein (DUF2141 family)
MIRLTTFVTAALGVALLTGAAPARAQDTATLTVTFEGIKTQKGAVMFVLSAGEAAYDGKAAPAGQAMLPATAASVSQTFRGLAPGRYGIKAFHDLDGDGKMGSNPFGMPTEPFAFSNNAPASMGPPGWGAASFEVKAGDNTHVITMD